MVIVYATSTCRWTRSGLGSKLLEVCCACDLVVEDLSFVLKEAGELGQLILVQFCKVWGEE